MVFPLHSSGRALGTRKVRPEIRDNIKKVKRPKGMSDEIHEMLVVKFIRVLCCVYAIVVGGQYFRLQVRNVRPFLTRLILHITRLSRLTLTLILFTRQSLHSEEQSKKR